MKKFYIFHLQRTIFAIASICAIFNAQAANQTINSIADSDTATTLRYALNQQTANDIYTFALGGKINLTSNLPQIIADGLKLDAALSAITINGGGFCQIFNLSNTVNNIAFSNISLQNAVSNMDGGAICFNSANANKIDNEGLLTFKNNSSYNNGAAIYSKGSLEITGDVTFGGAGANEGNRAYVYAGAIYLYTNATILKLGGTANFLYNKAIFGGAIYFESSNSNKIENSSTLVFKGNDADYSGGAISSNGNLEITGAAIFGGVGVGEGNLAELGAAIYLGPSATTLEFGSTADFLYNQSSDTATIYFQSSGANRIDNAGKLTFKGNSSNFEGAAIYSRGSLEITGDVVFGGMNASEGNSAIYTGGAIYLCESSLKLGGTTDFIKNRAYDTTYGRGGAIYLSSSSNKIENANMLTFKGNSAGVSGGAIYSSGNLEITGTTIFGGTGAGEGNSAKSLGGAIYLDGYKFILGATEFLNNTASNGGAIYGSHTLTLEVNANTNFSKNLASGFGGAVYIAENEFGLYAKGGNVSFSGNKMGANLTAPDPSATGTANSIYLGTSSSVYLAAANGKIITLSDPIKATASTTHTVSINKLSNGTITTGNVVFSGANYAANSADIKSDINANTTIFGGAFSVIQNARYGTSTSKLTANSGAMLAGNGHILGTTTMLSGSILAPGDNPSLITFDNLILKGGSILEIENGDIINIENIFTLDSSALIEKIVLELSGFNAIITDYKFVSLTDFTGLGEDLTAYFDFTNGYQGSIFKGTGGIYINATQVPEPSTYAFIFAFIALSFVIWRKRK